MFGKWRSTSRAPATALVTNTTTTTTSRYTGKGWSGMSAQMLCQMITPAETTRTLIANEVPFTGMCASVARKLVGSCKPSTAERPVADVRLLAYENGKREIWWIRILKNRLVIKREKLGIGRVNVSWTGWSSDQQASDVKKNVSRCSAAPGRLLVSGYQLVAIDSSSTKQNKPVLPNDEHRKRAHHV